MLIGVYGPQSDRATIIFLNELKGLRLINELPWIVMGDFNLFRSTNDTTSGSINLGTMKEFNNTIELLELLEIPLVGRNYTWSSKRLTPTFLKLDWVLISSHWNSMGASYSLQDAPTTASDHTQLILDIRTHHNISRRSFKFETYWLRNTQTREVVQKAWAAAPVTQNYIKKLKGKIEETRKKLRY